MLWNKKEEIIKLTCELSKAQSDKRAVSALNFSQASTIAALKHENKRLQMLLDACKQDLKVAVNGVQDPCEYCIHYPGNNSGTCQAECSRFTYDGFEWRGVKVNE